MKVTKSHAHSRIDLDGMQASLAPVDIALGTSLTVLDHTNTAEAVRRANRIGGGAGTVFVNDDDSENQEDEEDEEDEDEENEDEGDEEDDDEEDDGGGSVEGGRTIRGRLASIFCGHANFNGAFSFKEAYPNAPNPGLQVADLGIIGLPLNAREAETIKTRCELAPFNKGERTPVEQTVRDTWEMDALKVTFANPAWDTFISKVVKEICRTLGVKFDASQPRCELYKLLLYETGSHFLPHVDTGKVDGTFATMMVVLPSKFSGGAAHLSHSSLSAAYDCCESSQSEITILSWYTDVIHEMKPITGGYRLALSYNLLHTTQSPRPALLANEDLVQELRQILLDWESNDDGSAPDKIIHLLKHTYPPESLRVSALEGVDAHKVGLFNNLAMEMGFGLGLASIECHLSGLAEHTAKHRSGSGHYSDECYEHHIGYCGEQDDYSDEEWDYSEPNDWADGEVEEREMSIAGLVNLDGKPISNFLECNEETETIPVDLIKDVEGGKYEQEYEGDEGIYPGNLNRWYQRTVLVIWPKWYNYAIKYSGASGFERALKDIQVLSSAIPTANGLGLVEFLLREAARKPVAVAQAVCRIALQWGNSAIWTRVILTCCTNHGLLTLPAQSIFCAIKQFGLDTLEVPLEHLLNTDQHNESRLQFLRHLNRWAGELSDYQKKHQVQKWTSVQVVVTMRTLRKPQKTEQKSLLAGAKAQGGINYLKDHLLPQLVSLADSDFLREFAQSVQADVYLPEGEAKTAVISSLLAAAISKATFFTPPKPLAPTDSCYRSQLPEPDHDQSATAKLYVHAARDLHCEEMIGLIIDRVTSMNSLAADAAAASARHVMLPLTSFFIEHARLHPQKQLPPRFDHLQQTAVTQYLSWLEVHSSSLTKNDINTLLESALGTGELDLFVATVWPQLERMKLSANGLQVIMTQIDAKRELFAFPAGYDGPSMQSMIATLAKKTVLAVSISTPRHILDALSWCLKRRMPELCAEVVKRFCDPMLTDDNYIKNVLLPLLPLVRKWAAQHNQNMDNAIQKIVAIWTTKVLGSLPAATASLSTQFSDLSKWACPCHACIPARGFLMKSQESSMKVFSIGATRRKHLEGLLSIHAPLLATWDPIRTTPQGLSINKSSAWCQLITWRKHRTDGINILKSLSSDKAELRRILGPEYNRVCSALRESPPVQSQAQPASTAQPNVTTTAWSSTVPAVRAAPPANGSSGQLSGDPAFKKRKVAHDPDTAIDLS